MLHGKVLRHPLERFCASSHRLETMSTTTPMSKQTKKNSKATGQRFTQAETNTLLNLITKLMPMGHEGWENPRDAKLATQNPLGSPGSRPHQG